MDFQRGINRIPRSDLVIIAGNNKHHPLAFQSGPADPAHQEASWVHCCDDAYYNARGNCEHHQMPFELQSNHEEDLQTDIYKHAADVIAPWLK